MENGQYSEAAETFEKYLDVDSVLYWMCTDFVNEYSYTKQGVKKALQKCHYFA